nr:TraR/DksA family transcriptional regulator [Burkholderia pyrrocinia]
MAALGARVARHRSCRCWTCDDATLRRGSIDFDGVCIRRIWRFRVFASVPSFRKHAASAARCADSGQHMRVQWVYPASNASGASCVRARIRARRRRSCLPAAHRRDTARRTFRAEPGTGETAMALDQLQRQTLQQRLKESEQTLRAEIRTSEDQRASESYADLAGASPDEGDEANADLFVDVDHALIGMRLTELRAVGRAQQRMRDGSYGECIDCDASVGYERLLARPTAERCTHCQSVYERRYATTPRASL